MEAPNGLEIIDNFQSYYDDEVHHDRLYSNLDTLAEMGLIEVDEKDRGATEYPITESGLDEITAHRIWESEYIESLISFGGLTCFGDGPPNGVEGANNGEGTAFTEGPLTGCLGT